VLTLPDAPTKHACDPGAALDGCAIAAVAVATSGTESEAELGL